MTVRGKVVTTFPEKGYCFVMGDDKLHRFVHATWVMNHMFHVLEVGDAVEYEPVQGEKGPQARSVRMVGRT